MIGRSIGEVIEVEAAFRKTYMGYEKAAVVACGYCFELDEMGPRIGSDTNEGGWCRTVIDCG